MKKRQVHFTKAVIIGPGLIGASFGMALRRTKIARAIVGVARHTRTLNTAIAKKAIDCGSTDVLAAVDGADLIVLATPVKTITHTLTAIAKRIAPGCIVIDVGSTKAEIVAHAHRVLPKNVFFIGTHPMAGSEKTGPEFARADLFKDSLCFLTPVRATDPVSLETICRMWRRLGAKTVRMTPRRHDETVGYVSHLPHLISAVLIAAVPEPLLTFSATGLHDMTRLAAGDPGMWRDISLSNQTSIKKAISRFERTLRGLKRMLGQSRGKALAGFLAAAQKKRETIAR